ncbi:Carbapenem and cephamycin resistance [Hyphodiscus hymeniophilus]|uniref:Carbapenem and cephamycin resistance n=1 Tax=Hyphodiscus hymeniophilus TaxID=353542 RepID=A0A9P6SQJ9_9HELO|nr:Carbapenem and cephamycin resistance [Hyphodiscus hymeniophilus]
MTSLRADVYVAPPIPWTRPNGQKGGLWSPISCTLIHGQDEAVLVDTPITTSQTEALISWIKSVIPRKKLTAIYITHGHGDHFFGIPLLLKAFPGCKALATAATLEHMEEQIRPDVFEGMWGGRFSGEIPRPFELAQALPAGNEIFLEGNVLRAVEVGQADTHDSTVLWVPAIKLAVCGDVVYGDVHQMLGECDTKAKRGAWIAAIRKVQDLRPEIVVAGHKKTSEIDGAFHLENSIRYIESFEEFLEGGAKDPRDLSRKMLERFPTRFNEGTLAIGSMNAFKSSKLTTKL